MELKFNLKSKDISAKVDAEKLVEKGMDNREKDWKEKYTVKHNAKKEMLELKHKQKLEDKEQSLKKKSIIKEVFDGINTNKQLKLEEKRRLEEERIRKEEEELNRLRKERKIISIVVLVVSFIVTVLGFAFSSIVDGLVVLGCFGVLGTITGLVLLLTANNIKKK